MRLFIKNIIYIITVSFLLSIQSSLGVYIVVDYILVEIEGKIKENENKYLFMIVFA